MPESFDPFALRESVSAPAVTPADNTVDVVRERIVGETQASEAEMLRITEEAIIEVTVAELKKVCSKNPNHPDAVTFRNSVKKHRDDQKVAVSKHNLLAVIDNKYVEMFSTVEEGEDGPVTINRKRLVDTPPVAVADPKIPERPPEITKPNE